MKLSTANLSRFAPAVAVPRYNRAALGQSIVHIGVGGFHRAHLAAYCDDLLQRGHDARWGICGVGLLPPDRAIRDALVSQEHLYTLVERGARGDNARVIGSLANFLFAPDNAEAVIEKMASEETEIVSLTITEGGYYNRENRFDAEHPDIQHDLGSPSSPRSSFGFLLEALDRRRRRGLAPPSLLSCDNVQSNGDNLRAMLLAFAELRDPILAKWMERNCRFPNSMVDRITPATTGADKAMLREKFGIDDAWPVVCEEFRQWVIEDAFVSGRPAWEEVGAQITSDVLPYEKMKLRLLNASHQALCYPGLLLRHEFVHEAIADAPIRALVKRLMDREVTPILPPVPGVDLENYKATLLERFGSAAIRDTLARISTYGSVGMPRFLLPSIEDQLARGGPIDLLCLVVASWIYALSQPDFPQLDPLAARLGEIARAAKSDPEPLLARREIFSESLASAPAFAQKVGEFLQSFYARGARATLEKAVSL